MAFCEKCGKELGPGGACDCQKAGAEQAAPAPSATPAASAVPAEPAPNNNKLIGIIAVAAIAVVLLILIFLLVGKSSYKDPFKDLQKLVNKQSTDIFVYEKVTNDPLSAEFLKTLYDIVKSNDNMKEGYEDLQEKLKDFYEDIKGFKITEIEIKKAQKMKASELRSISGDIYDKDNSEGILEGIDDMDSDDYEELAESLDISKSQAKKLIKSMEDYYKSLGKAKVQEGYDVQVIVHAKYDGDTDKTDRIDVQVVKVNGKWYIYNASSFFRNIRFDKDLDDISLDGLYDIIGSDFAYLYFYLF